MQAQKQGRGVVLFLTLTLVFSACTWALLFAGKGLGGQGGQQYVMALMWSPGVAAILTTALLKLDWRALGFSESLTDFAALNARSKFWGDDQRAAFKNWEEVADPRNPLTGRQGVNERIMLRELLRRADMMVIIENKLDALVRLHTPWPPGLIGWPHQYDIPSNLAPESLSGPNAGLSEVLIPRAQEWRERRRAHRARAATVGYDPGRERRAEQRARQLLRSCVNDEEWGMYRDLGFIRVWGRESDGPGGHQDVGGALYAYLVYPHKPIVAYLAQTGRLLNEYCVEFPDETRPYGSPRLPD